MCRTIQETPEYAIFVTMFIMVGFLRGVRLDQGPDWRAGRDDVVHPVLRTVHHAGPLIDGFGAFARTGLVAGANGHQLAGLRVARRANLSHRHPDVRQEAVVA